MVNVRDNRNIPDFCHFLVLL